MKVTHGNTKRQWTQSKYTHTHTHYTYIVHTHTYIDTPVQSEYVCDIAYSGGKKAVIREGRRELDMAWDTGKQNQWGGGGGGGGGLDMFQGPLCVHTYGPLRTQCTVRPVSCTHSVSPTQCSVHTQCPVHTL